MGCSFIAGIQSALGSEGLGLPGVETVAPVVAGAFLGPAAGALLGTSATVGAAAAGAATGALGSAASGGDLLSGAVSGGLGGLAGGAIGGALGLGSGTAAAAGGTVGDMAAIYQNAYGMSAADAMAAAESAMSSGMTAGQLASTVADAGLMTGAQLASLTGNSSLGGSSLLSNASSLLPSGGGGAGNALSSLISGGSSLIAGEMGASAAKDALSETQRQFNINQLNMQPWLKAGTKALGAQQDLMGLGAGGAESQLSSLMSSPGYQFRLNQGKRTLEGSSAARGGMGSGKAGAAMTQYGQDYATNEYGNRLNQLAGLSGTGQTQANNLATLGQNYASEAGNSALTAAQSRQSGILGAGQAFSGYLNPLPKQKTLADLLGGY